MTLDSTLIRNGPSLSSTSSGRKQYSQSPSARGTRIFKPFIDPFFISILRAFTPSMLKSSMTGRDMGRSNTSRAVPHWTAHPRKSTRMYSERDMASSGSLKA
jgi:hypothetical protein